MLQKNSSTTKRILKRSVLLGLISILLSWVPVSAASPLIYFDIASGTYDSSLKALTVYNGKLYFSARIDRETGAELWAYDGVNAPSLNYDINSGSGNSNITSMAVFQGKLFFGANNNSGVGIELMSYDGVNPPEVVADIKPGTGGSSPKYFAVFNNKLYFYASGDAAAGELWEYDGTNPPTRISDINSGDGSSQISSMAVYNGKLYFNATSMNETELYSYDGTNPVEKIDVCSGSCQSFPSGLIVFNGKLYFTGSLTGGESDRRLLVYDGVNAPEIALDISAGKDKVVYHNKLYFSYYSVEHGLELWMYDGVNYPSEVADINDGTEGSSPQDFAIYNDRLYFYADGGSAIGAELWSYLDIDTPSPAVSTTSPASGATISPTGTLLVTFNTDMRNDGSASAVTNPSNYILLEANGDGFQKSDCTTDVGTQDTTITVDSVTYSNNNGDGPYQATLTVNGGTSLASGSYRLLVCGTTSVKDAVGNKINQGLSDSSVDFTVLGTKAAAALPQTGFAPGRITQLPLQTLSKEYTSYDDLRIEIPELNVAAPIVGVPVSEDGWDITWLEESVGWLNGTAFPTWAGNSALTAHVVDANGEPGLFFDLNTLHWGDKVLIHAWDQTYTYEVRSVQEYVNPEDGAIITHEDYPWITLITCQGYNNETNSYQWRIVVRAVQVSME